MDRAILAIAIGLGTVAGWALVATIAMNVVYSEMSKSAKAALAREMAVGPQNPDEFFSEVSDDARE